MRIDTCWAFSGGEQPPYPTIEIVVSYDDRKAKVIAKVDTGFNGWLTLGTQTVQALSMKPVGRILVATAVGNREVPIYRVNLSQPELNLIQTTLAIGTERPLTGRALLENRRWLLDCKEHRFCHLTQTS